jgi:hypothetical protein
MSRTTAAASCGSTMMATDSREPRVPIARSNGFEIAYEAIETDPRWSGMTRRRGERSCSIICRKKMRGCTLGAAMSRRWSSRKPSGKAGSRSPRQQHETTDNQVSIKAGVAHPLWSFGRGDEALPRWPDNGAALGASPHFMEPDVSVNCVRLNVASPVNRDPWNAALLVKAREEDRNGFWR